MILSPTATRPSALTLDLLSLRSTGIERHRWDEIALSLERFSKHPKSAQQTQAQQKS